VKHYCHAQNCRVSTPRKFLMCGYHWHMVPHDLQRTVWKHFDVRQLRTHRPTDDWYAAANAAIEYVYKIEQMRNSAQDKGVKTMASNKLEMSVLVGAESKQWLLDLTKVVERLEKVAKIASSSLDEEGPQQDVDADQDEDTTSTISAAALRKGKKGKTDKKAAAADEDEEEFDLGASESEDEAPVVTKKDLIAACRDNREAAIKALKKLKVASIHELKPAQYAKVLAEIGA
jgi:hypothetical protein